MDPNLWIKTDEGCFVDEKTFAGPSWRHMSSRAQSCKNPAACGRIGSSWDLKESKTSFFLPSHSETEIYRNWCAQVGRQAYENPTCWLPWQKQPFSSQEGKPKDSTSLDQRKLRPKISMPSCLHCMSPVFCHFGHHLWAKVHSGNDRRCPEGPLLSSMYHIWANYKDVTGSHPQKLPTILVGDLFQLTLTQLWGPSVQ